MIGNAPHLVKILSTHKILLQYTPNVKREVLYYPILMFKSEMKAGEGGESPAMMPFPFKAYPDPAFPLQQ